MNRFLEAYEGGAAIATRQTAPPARATQRQASSLTFGFVGTFPPTKCGIATFTRSLSRAVADASSFSEVGIVACVDETGTYAGSAKVVAELVRGSTASLAGAVAELNTYDVVVVQHEFGIFGGEDGEDVVDLVSRLESPCIVVLHTVLPNPSPNQRRIIERLAQDAESIVVQSRVAEERLLAAHRVDPSRVTVIPHGARRNLSWGDPAPAEGRRPVILTWGLIGSGKGIEHAIDAMAELQDIEPAPLYIVQGETHPNVVKHSGEAYRESLIERARSLGVEHMVKFDDGYRDTAAVLESIRAADIVLLPYLSRDQVVSGVLVEAVASGKPVVSTAFPHAVELLGEGSGITVPHEDAKAIAAALRSLLEDPEKTAEVAATARRQAPKLFWPNVGRRYRELAMAITNRRALAS